MGGHKELRWLIDNLEALCLILPDDSSTLREGLSKKLKSESLPAFLKDRDQCCRAEHGLSELLSLVQFEMGEHDAAIKRIRNSVLPAVNLPVELLGRIFEMACFQPRKSDTDGLGHIQKKIRAVICSTCSRWRDVAVKSTLLWSCVVITAGSREGGLRDPNQPDTVLTRAGARPITLYLSNLTDAADQAILPTTLRQISSFSPKYDTFQICAQTHGADNLSLLYNALGSPNIRMLVLHWTHESTPSDPRRAPIIVDLTSMRHLRDLSIRFTCHSAVGRSARIRCSHALGITRLRLNGFLNNVACVGLIFLCPNLVMLNWHSEIYVSLDKAIMGLPSGRIAHQDLIDLELSGVVAARLLNYIDALDLARLTLWGIMINEHDNASFWSSPDCPFYHPRVFPKMQFIDVEEAPLHALLPFLSIQHSAEQLNLEIPISGDIVDLIVPLGHLTLLPNLRKLLLPFDDDKFELVAELLRRKNELASTILPFTLVLDDAPRSGSQILALAQIYTGPVQLQFRYRESDNEGWDGRLLWPQ